MTGVATGFYGKLPSRGDFVRAGLPRNFVDAWDGWWQRVLAATREGEADWTACWLEAPIWRFHLAGGVCGPAAVLGVWLPSVDRVGRYFPLTVAAVGSAGELSGAGEFLNVAEAAALDAVAHDLEPAVLAARVGAAFSSGAAEPLPAAMAGTSVWWTKGAPRVPATHFSTTGLPDALAGMLDARHLPADTSA